MMMIMIIIKVFYRTLYQVTMGLLTTGAGLMAVETMIQGQTLDDFGYCDDDDALMMR